MMKPAKDLKNLLHTFGRDSDPIVFINNLDAIIFDLEDAVTAEEKAQLEAVDQAQEATAQLGQPSATAVIRAA